MKRKLDIFVNINLTTISEVIVFGAGYYGMMSIYLLDYLGIKVISCMDNDEKKKGKLIIDKVVCKTPYFVKKIPVVIAIRDKKMSEKVCRQCKLLGYIDFIYLNYDKIEDELKKLPDKEYLEMMFPIMNAGRVIKWDNLITFNEKMQWLKLYNRKQEYIKMVDKYEVKAYISDKLGEEYVLPTLGVWDSFEEIDFNKLPNQFAIKCTHDSGGVVIVYDKNNIDKEYIKKTINKNLKKDFFYVAREWPYKNVKHRIIGEVLLETKNKKLPYDYKVSCFNGKAVFFSVAIDRESDLSFNYYNLSYELINDLVLEEKGTAKKFVLPKKELLDEMIVLAEKISKNIPYVRMDFYIEDKIYFGEITFFPDGGWGTWSEEWQVFTGNLLKIS